MSAIRQAFKHAATTLLPSQFWLVKRPAACRSVALTFDDGPHPEYTPQVLDILADQRATATFFVIGERAEQHPDLIRRIVAEGHTLGNHTWTHSEPNVTSAETFLVEVRQTQQYLQDLTGQPISLFRPPKGQLTVCKTWGLWGLGQQIVLWSTDPKDYRTGSETELAHWARTSVPQAGEIILLHDAFSHAIPQLALLISRYRDQYGLRCTAL